MRSNIPFYALLAAALATLAFDIYTDIQLDAQDAATRQATIVKLLDTQLEGSK